jgi:hypothetical protein
LATSLDIHELATNAAKYDALSVAARASLGPVVAATAGQRLTARGRRAVVGTPFDALEVLLDADIR